MSEVNAPVLEALVKMNEGTPEASGLDAETYILTRIAALASVGAPPASYLEPGSGVRARRDGRAGAGKPDRDRPRDRLRSSGFGGQRDRRRHGVRDRSRRGVGDGGRRLTKA